ncbi:hypothetical protein, partial [Actinomadura rubrisoli]
MGAQPLSCPFFLAVGLRTEPDESDAELRAFADFYDSVHLGEVVDLNDGFVSAARYELAEPAAGVPYWLALYGIDGEDSARRFLARLRGPAERRAVYSAGPPAWRRAGVVWRMIWQNAGAVGVEDLDPG